jgi:hypothetical protein
VKSKPAPNRASEFSFGLVFGGFFTIVAFWPALVHGNRPHWWALPVALIFAGCAFFTPRALAPLNWLWAKIGLTLHRIVNPLLMALIYFGAVVPMGLVMRARGRDFLRLKREKETDSYWIPRVTANAKAMSLLKQF